jgi:hypothetical protein
MPVSLLDSNVRELLRPKRWMAACLAELAKILRATFITFDRGFQQFGPVATVPVTFHLSPNNSTNV